MVEPESLERRVMNALRALDWAERYYWFLDRLGPKNIAAVAEIDRYLAPNEIQAALDEAQARHALLRARIVIDRGDLVFAESTGRIPLTVTNAGEGNWRDKLAADLDVPFEAATGPLARCHYLPIGRAQRAVVALLIHHAAGDARAIVTALQHILRYVDSGSEALPPSTGVPPPLHELFPAHLRTPRAAIEVLASVRKERAEQVPVATYPFHARGPRSQTTRLDRLVLDPAATAALRDRAHAAGATVNGSLAADVLAAGADLFNKPAERLLVLATPTDLRQRVEPPIEGDAVRLAIGLLTTPYAVRGGDHDVGLAREVSEQTSHELDRGESHLFYRIARAAGYAPTDEGLNAFAAAIDAAPQNLGLSNLGVVPSNDDPRWLRSLSFALSTSPNQVAFIAVTTYGDRLVLNIATDGARLTADITDKLVDGICRRIGAIRDD